MQMAGPQRSPPSPIMQLPEQQSPFWLHACPPRRQPPQRKAVIPPSVPGAGRQNPLQQSAGVAQDWPSPTQMQPPSGAAPYRQQR